MLSGSLEAVIWAFNIGADILHYWNNRFSKCEVYFENGIVVRVR
jgi:hypothetical protein